MAQRFDLVDGAMVEAANGRFVVHADISREHAAELQSAKSETATLQQSVAKLEQGIRQAQADLGFVLPTDMDQEKSELIQEIDRLRSRVGKL